MNKRATFFKVYVLVLLQSFSAYSQTNKTYVHNTSYDENGKVIQEDKTYYDNLGRVVQLQSRMVNDNNVIATQTLYDDYGRKVLETLPVPLEQTVLNYKDKFITNANGANYSTMDFDRRVPFAADPASPTYSSDVQTANYKNSNNLGTVAQPFPVNSGNAGTLGYYYSNNNAAEPYVASGNYPYSRIVYNDINGGEVVKTSAPGNAFRMGGGHEKKTYTMTSFNELDHLYGKNQSWVVADYTDANNNGQGTITSFPITNNNVLKTIQVDRNGQEMITFTSPDGKQLATCLSGQKNGQNVNTWSVNYSQPGIASLNAVPGTVYMDIHLPAGCENSLGISNVFDPGNHFPVTYQILFLGGGNVKFGSSTQYTGTHPNLAPGYYRIVWMSGGVPVSVKTNGVSTTYNKFSFNITHNVNYYNFTINYYDKAGHLKLTVPPTGVDYTYQPSTTTTPAHTMIGSINYDSYGEVVSSVSPDAGLSEYLYRDDGLVRFTRNTLQRASNSTAGLQKYSYVNYDNLGRIIETGEYNPTTSGAGSAIAFSQSNVTATLDATRCSQQNYSMYDVGDISYSTYQQQYLPGKVSKTWNSNSTTWYSYDELGRIAWTVQQINNMPSSGSSKFCTINYSYDLNGNITQVAYQKESSSEDFYYYYQYDNDKRLKTVSTSTDGINKTQQAAYYYYKHGPLKRVELANKAQGLDYVYTINGWLKSINAPELNVRDPGRDGRMFSSGVFPDLFGMALDYFTFTPKNIMGKNENYTENDYSRTNTSIQTYTGGQNAFNGRVKAQRWQTKLPALAYNASNISYKNGQLSYQYTYDNKNQLTTATFAQIGNQGSYNMGGDGRGPGPQLGTSPNNYQDYLLTGTQYDLNGNITALQRYAYSTLSGGSGINMDQLGYNYNPLTNRLKNVVDNISANNYPGREFSPGQQQTDNNYIYDPIGEQIQDNNPTQPSQTQYNVYGTVNQIQYTNSGGTTNTFLYDEKGNRIVKSDGTTTTWYIRDANGNVMSIYEKNGSGSLMQMEVGLYADNRIGVYYPQSGVYQYELADHLGNVRSTFTTANKLSISTGFSGTGTDDYLLTLTPFQSQKWIYVDNSFDNGGSPAASLKLVAGADALIFKLAVKAGQVISGSLQAYAASGTPPQAMLVINFTNSEGNIVGTVPQNLTTTAAQWQTNNFSVPVPADGTMYFVINNTTSSSAGTVWIDNINVSFSSGGGVPVPSVQGFADYYPGGSVMPGRYYAGANSYRYGYQGQYAECDPETGLNNFEARMYDPLLMRWNTTDPANEFASPYVGMGNNPVSATDPHGTNIFDNIDFGGFIGQLGHATAGRGWGSTREVHDQAQALGVAYMTRAAQVEIFMLSVAFGGEVGVAAAEAAGVGGFEGGAIAGEAAGGAGGFIQGMGNSWIDGGNVEDILWSGFAGGIIGAGTGALVGGIIGGISAYRSGLDFWDGERIPDKFPLVASTSDNIGSASSKGGKTVEDALRHTMKLPEGTKLSGEEIANLDPRFEKAGYAIDYVEKLPGGGIKVKLNLGGRLAVGASSDFSDIDGAVFNLTDTNVEGINAVRIQSSTATYGGKPFNWYVNDNQFSLGGEFYSPIFRR